MPSGRHVVVAFVLSSLGVQPIAFAAAAPPKVHLTLAQGRKIALARQAGDVKSGELEHEKGRWIYSFDIVRDGATHEVGVDANTGKIVEDKVETAADEAREQSADAKKPR